MQHFYKFGDREAIVNGTTGEVITFSVGMGSLRVPTEGFVLAHARECSMEVHGLLHLCVCVWGGVRACAYVLHGC